MAKENVKQNTDGKCCENHIYNVFFLKILIHTYNMGNRVGQHIFYITGQDCGEKQKYFSSM